MRNLLIAIVILAATAAHAQAATPEQDIRVALTRWTDDFNAGHADAVCGLFAPALIADVRGAPERDFDTQCKLLREAIADPERSDTEAFEVKEVLVGGNIAAVRIVWTTTMRIKATGETTTSVYQGLDIFEHAGDRGWHIIRYMAYERE
jgi:ketosteroid isomerase-like protein